MRGTGAGGPAFKGVPIAAHAGWNGLLDRETLDLLAGIEESIGDDFTPGAGRIFRFLGVDPSKVKVVILGQDPYCDPGEATGRAFEVGNITAWDQVKKNDSLQNILKLLHKNATGCRTPAPIRTVRRWRKLRETILPPDRLFANWEEQGVLLLNAALTCKTGVPESHSETWAPFTEKVIAYLREKAPEAHWLVWGDRAKKLCAGVPERFKHESLHPGRNWTREGLATVEKYIARHTRQCHNFLMKLSAWARSQGVSYKTAWRMWKDGKLPVPAEQLPTGTVIVHAEQFPSAGIALYARVSSADQKQDLDRQLARLTEYAVRHGLPIVDAVKEIGSGLNGHRKGMARLLRDPRVGAVLVEHRDRLVRFGFEYIEASLAAQGRRILVMEPDEVTDDIVRDLHEVIVSMCARLYGKRAAAHRAQKAMEALRCE